MIRAVIFDMDGVIADTEPVYDKWVKEFLDAHQIFVEDTKRRTLSGLSFSEFPPILAQWWKEYGGQTITEEDVIGLYTNFVDDEEREYRMPYAEVKDRDIEAVMAALKGRGYQLAIASSSNMENIRRAMKEIGLEEYVDFVVSGDMFRKSKPDPEIYFHTVEKLGLSVEECIAVEDSTYGIQAAKAAGLITIAKRDERFPFDQTAADVIIDRLSELLDVIERI